MKARDVLAQLAVSGALLALLVGLSHLIVWGLGLDEVQATGFGCGVQYEGAPNEEG